jgi:hypothetical protein
MSDDEAEAMMDELERKWDSQRRRNFLSQMEKKHFGRHSTH